MVQFGFLSFDSAKEGAETGLQLRVVESTSVQSLEESGWKLPADVDFPGKERAKRDKSRWSVKKYGN